MTHQDKVFMTTFAMVLGALAVLAVIFYLIAQVVSAQLDQPRPAGQNIQAVGSVHYQDQDASGAQASASGSSTGGGSDAGASQQAAADAGSAQASPEVQQVVATCGGCHNTGVLGAPKIGSKEDWAPRVEKGMDTLVKNAKQGIGSMPPQAQYSEQQLQAAIEHMLKQSGL